MFMDHTLPLATGDEEEVLEGLSGWDALEEAEVYVKDLEKVDRCQIRDWGTGLGTPDHSLSEFAHTGQGMSARDAVEESSTRTMTTTAT